MKAILKHELKNYFHSMMTYTFCAFMLLFVGIGALMYNIQAAVANFEYVLSFVCIGLAVIIPVLTMRSISEEKKQRTDQLLYSLPLSMAEVVVGKFFAIVIVFCVPIAIIAFYPLIFAQFGEVYLLTSYGSLLMFVLLGAAMVSIGMFISSLTENQGFAAGISIALLVFNYFSVSLAEYVSSTVFGALAALCVLIFAVSMLVGFMTKSEAASVGTCFGLCIATGILYFTNSGSLEGLFPKLISAFSLFERFNTVVGGVFELTGVVFYLSVTAFFLFLTTQSLEKRRYN